MKATENIVGTLKGVRGSTVDMVFDLFFTERRVIGAIVLHPSDFANEYSKPDLTTLIIGGYYKQREIKIRSQRLMEERRSGLEGKSPDEILTSNRANVQVDYENIVSARIKKGFLGNSLEFEVQTPPKKKINFSIEADELSKAEELLRTILPDKAR